MDYKTAINKAASLCSQQEYCRSDILKKLEKWNVPFEKHEQIIEKLVEENFIDETRFTTYYVRDKHKFNRWGRKKIWWQLKQKGISNDTISEALENLDLEEYRNNLKEVLKEKHRQVNRRDPIKQKAAIIRNAVSKGYEYEEIIPLVEQLLKK